VVKAGGGDGFADLLGYKDDLGNPPLLVTSDLERIEIRTNFTGFAVCAALA
jgi:hypothetical protein